MSKSGSIVARVFIILAAIVAIGAGAQRGPAADPLVFDTFQPPPCSPLGKPTGGCAAGERHRIRLIQLADGLVQPRQLSFLPDGRTILVTEPPGRVRVIRDGALVAAPVSGWPNPSFSVRQLHSVAVHPQFAQNRLVYLSYMKGRSDGMTTVAVARGRFDGSALSDVADVFVADAWLLGGPLSSVAEFGPDGMIYLAVGDHDRLLNSADMSIRILAQDLGTHVGKILRLRDDGTAPADNPFVSRQGAKPEIYTYGHRTVSGLAWDAQGQMWAVEIGPLGGDELNRLQPGRNYGWPLVSFGRLYNNGDNVSDQPYTRPGMENPRIFWVPSISPSGLIVYSGDRFPWWRGNFLLGALNGQQLQRVGFNQPGPQWEIRESMLTELERRVRYVAQGPDGFIYIATEKNAPQGGAAPQGGPAPRGGGAAAPLGGPAPPDGLGPPGAPPAPMATGVVYRIEPAE